MVDETQMANLERSVNLALAIQNLGYTVDVDIDNLKDKTTIPFIFKRLSKNNYKTKNIINGLISFIGIYLFMAFVFLIGGNFILNYIANLNKISYIEMTYGQSLCIICIIPIVIKLYKNIKEKL